VKAYQETFTSEDEKFSNKQNTKSNVSLFFSQNM